MGTIATNGPLGGRGRLWPLLPVIFLPNLAAPLSGLFQSHPSPLRLVLVLGGMALFIALYLWTSWGNDVSRPVYPAVSSPRSLSWLWGPIIGLICLSIALVLGDGSRWLALLIFTSAAAGGRFSLGPAIRLVLLMAGLTLLMGLITQDTLGDYGPGAFWSGMAGVLTIIINHFRRTNRDLHAAREEITRLAVETERLRFARDLHDLLGHDLARIALQSEVAEALSLTAPQQAAVAMRDVGRVARTALQEVRAAVAGYRQPSLTSELRGAGEILAAAGIAYRCEGAPVPVAPAIEAALAWAVREGVTNAVKHSRARRCTVRLSHDEGSIAVEVLDDGAGQPMPDSSGGSGLAGLAERAVALGGRCEAGLRPEGGYRLALTLPLAKVGGVEPAAGERPAEAASVAVGGGR